MQSGNMTQLVTSAIINRTVKIKFKKLADLLQ